MQRFFFLKRTLQAQTIYFLFRFANAYCEYIYIFLNLFVGGKKTVATIYSSVWVDTVLVLINFVI